MIHFTGDSFDLRIQNATSSTRKESTVIEASVQSRRCKSAAAIAIPTTAAIISLCFAMPSQVDTFFSSVLAPPASDATQRHSGRRIANSAAATLGHLLNERFGERLECV